MRSIGLSPANVGDPIYYLTAPIFKTVQLQWADGKLFTIEVDNYNKANFYIESVKLNGKPLERNWLTHQEIQKGGKLQIKTSTEPNKKWGIKNQWISTLKE